MTTAGSFNPQDRYLYFLASNVSFMKFAARHHPNLLIAANMIGGKEDFYQVEALIQSGAKILLDSGIYSLAMDHVRKTGITHAEALNLSPERILGFADLMDKYLDIITRLGERAWGYIELDQGGMDNKIILRNKLEGLGLRPIPVYHPFGDSWDYFDHLAANYDRICIGNLANANEPDRLRILATIWERKRNHPGLWIHLLGYSPSELINTYPADSADISTWLAVNRWNGANERADGKSLGPLRKNFQYKIGSSKAGSTGYYKGLELSAVIISHQQRNWRKHMQDLTDLGIDLYPPPPTANQE